MAKDRRSSIAYGIATISLLALLSLFPTGQPQAALADSTPLVIRGGTLIDGTGADAVQNGAIVIEGGTIAAVGREEEIAFPPNAQVIDAHGGTILPGVLDPHTHFTHLLLESEDVLSPWLETGVTTVQDLGTRWFLVAYFRNAVASLRQPPRVQFAGPIITAVGGYPKNDWSDHGVATSEDARAFVAKLIEEQGGRSHQDCHRAWLQHRLRRGWPSCPHGGASGGDNRRSAQARSNCDRTCNRPHGGGDCRR